jgi:hypothetical protein
VVLVQRAQRRGLVADGARRRRRELAQRRRDGVAVGEALGGLAPEATQDDGLELGTLPWKGARPTTI